MIDRMTWALAVAHPEMRPEWLQARMLPAICARTRIPSPRIVINNQKVVRPKRILTKEDCGEVVFQPSVKMIVHVTARRCQVSVVDIMSHRRTVKVVRPRQIIMYAARKMTTLSMPQIGLRLGGRDHTTILNGVRKIERLLAAGDQEITAMTRDIMREVSELCAEESRAAA